MFLMYNHSFATGVFLQYGEIRGSWLMIARWLEHLEGREILRDLVGHLENTVYITVTS